MLELNVQADHVHLVVSSPPKYAASNFMGYLKGKLALCLFPRYEQLGRRYRDSIWGHAAIGSAPLAWMKSAFARMFDGKTSANK